VNEKLRDVEPIIIIAGSISAVIALIVVYRWYLCLTSFYRNFTKNVKLSIFKCLTKTPCGRSYLKKEEQKIVKSFGEQIKKLRKN
jgi:hypothetical protein